MAGKTISEKILSCKSGRDVRAGDIAVCRVDCAMGTDGSAPMAIDYFEQMGGKRIFDPGRIVFVLDHYPSPAPPGTALLHEKMRGFSSRFGTEIHEIGAGICHQLMVESGRILPGTLVIGADSHTVTGGALNAFATGIGSSDLAAAMISGHIWLKVPETIKVTLTGQAGEGVYPKDIALALVGMIGADGAAYQALEFYGSVASALGLEDRLVISNMAVEMGAKAGIFPADETTGDYLNTRTTVPWNAVASDPDAHYCREITLDISRIGPLAAQPHQVDRVVPLEDTAGIPIGMVFLGTCTGGRVRDFHQALEILEAGGGQTAPGVQLIAAPASLEIRAELELDGTLAKLESMGATILNPGCGSCCGTGGPVPGDGMNVISTANRNFKGRMGNGSAAIYLASPAACAAAAVTGRITDPRRIRERKK